MRSRFALLPTALLCVSLVACGGTSGTSSEPEAPLPGTLSSGTESTAKLPLVNGHLVGDDDMENDDTRPRGSLNGDDDDPVRLYGHRASATDRREVTTLIGRYYGLAVQEDGAAACSLLYSSLARNPSLTKTVPEDKFSARLGPKILPGERCAQAAVRQFKQNHRRLMADVSSLQVTAMRVSGKHGLAVLGFRGSPERWIPVVREGGEWKVGFLLDREMP
jgi:hypothetical protein